MLTRVKDLTPEQYDFVYLMLLEEFDKPRVKNAFDESVTPAQILTDELPSEYDVSLHNEAWVSTNKEITELYGVMQAEVKHATEIEVTEMFQVGLQTNFTYGKDSKQFMSIYVDKCHRITTSKLLPVNITPNNTYPSKDLKRYNARFVGYKAFYGRDADGKYMHQSIWEIITPTGLALYQGETCHSSDLLSD